MHLSALLVPSLQLILRISLLYFDSQVQAVDQLDVFNVIICPAPWVFAGQYTPGTYQEQSPKMYAHSPSSVGLVTYMLGSRYCICWNDFLVTRNESIPSLNC